MNKYFTINYHQLVYYCTLLFAFSLPLSRAAISFFLISFILLFIFYKDKTAAWKFIRTNPQLKIMGAFFIFLAFSVFWSTDTQEAINQIRLYSYWILIPILAVLLKKEWLRAILSAFLLGMLISELLAYAIYFDLWHFKGHLPNDPNPFMSHIHYSVFLATSAIILFNRILSNRYTILEKIPLSIFLLTTSINLFISGGRTGQIAYFLAIGLTLLFHYRMTIKSTILYTLFTTFLFVGAYFTLPIYHDRVHQTLSDIQKQQEGIYNTSVGLRQGFWLIALDAANNDPILGAGIGDYKYATMKALTDNNHNFDNEAINFFIRSDYHNQFLMILVQSGSIGLCLMLLLIFFLYRLKMHDIELKQLNYLFLSIYFVSSLSESLWISQFPIALFIFITALSLAASKPQSNPI